MENVWNSDIYRIGKSKLFYGIVVAASLIAFFLILTIRQDIHLGISVFGDLTAFRGIADIVLIGFEYHKGLGIFVAILLSIFIGQEYQWNTWQHKWMTSKSRVSIYLSKAVISLLTSAILFLLFEIIVFLGSGQMSVLATEKYAATMVCGVFLYAALGSVICMLSMLVRNSTAATIVCLGYVVLSETFISVIRNIGTAFPAMEKSIAWIIEHTVYGMSESITSASFSTAQTLPILFNAIAMMIISTVIGLFAFRKYEL